MKVYAQVGDDEDFVCREIHNVSVKSIVKAFKINLTKQKLSYRKKIGYVRLTLGKKDVAIFKEDVKGTTVLYIKIKDLSIAPKKPKNFARDLIIGMLIPVALLLISISSKTLIECLKVVFILLTSICCGSSLRIYIRAKYSPKIAVIDRSLTHNNKKLLKK